MPGLAWRPSQEKANPLFLGDWALQSLSRFARASEAQPGVDSRAEVKWKKRPGGVPGRLEGPFFATLSLAGGKTDLREGTSYGHSASELHGI